MTPAADHPTDLPQTPQPVRRREDLVAMLGSRICHDIISPLAAIGNGVELLAMGGKVDGPEMALISESVNNAKARIRFFRIAFGLASPGQRVGQPEVLSILKEMTQGGRTRIDWRAEGDQLRAEVKLAFLALQCLETAMPYGGVAHVARDGDGWVVTGAAARMKIDAALFESMPDPLAPVEIAPAQVQFALLPLEAARQDRQVSVALDPTQVVIRF